VTVEAAAMEIVKVLVTIVAPFLALGGAVFLFYAKNKSDHDQQLRNARQEIYLSYIKAMQAEGNLSVDVSEAAQARALVSRCSDWHQQVQLLAPDFVAKASLKFIGLQTLISLKAAGSHVEYVHMTQAEREEHTKFIVQCRDIRFALLKEMRRDLLRNSYVPPDITDIEAMELDGYWCLKAMRGSK